MKAKFTKKDAFELLPLIVAVLLSFFWLVTGDMVKNDPYLLGLFRGIIYPSIIYSTIKTIFI